MHRNHVYLEQIKAHKTEIIVKIIRNCLNKNNMIFKFVLLLLGAIECGRTDRRHRRFRSGAYNPFPKRYRAKKVLKIKLKVSDFLI